MRIIAITTGEFMRYILPLFVSSVLLAGAGNAFNDNTANGNGNYVGNSYDNHGISNNISNAINGSFNGGNTTVKGGITNQGGQGGKGGEGGNGFGVGYGAGYGGAAKATGGDASSDNAVSTTISNPRQPVSTAYSAPLVAADDTCMGSTSAGGQGVGFGLSLGSTWTDENCVRRKNARELHNMGKKKVALNLLCQDANIAAAFAAAGDSTCGTASVNSEAYSNTAEDSSGPAWKTGAYPAGGRRR